MIVDNQLTFYQNIQKNKTVLGRHCGLISKMSHFVPPSFLLKYSQYQANVKPSDKMVYMFMEEEFFL